MHPTGVIKLAEKCVMLWLTWWWCMNVTWYMDGGRGCCRKFWEGLCGGGPLLFHWYSKSEPSSMNLFLPCVSYFHFWILIPLFQVDFIFCLPNSEVLHRNPGSHLPSLCLEQYPITLSPSWLFLIIQLKCFPPERLLWLPSKGPSPVALHCIASLCCAFFTALIINQYLHIIIQTTHPPPNKDKETILKAAEKSNLLPTKELS